MYHKQILKDRYGQHFKIISDRDPAAPKALQAENFWNAVYTKQFIQNMDVPHAYWRNALLTFGNSSHALTDSEVENVLSDLLIQGRLKAYPVSIPDFVEHPPENRVVKKQDALYRFASASTLFLSNPAEVKQFKSADDSEAFLNGLNPDTEQLKTIANDLEITLPATASVNPAVIKPAIAKAMAAGQVVIIVDKVAAAPASEQQTEAKNDVGNREAGLGAAADDDEKEKQEEQPPCKFTKYSIKCSHGRSITIDPAKQKEGKVSKLEVVSASTKATKDKQEKITIELDLDTPCSSHEKEQVSVNNDKATFIGPTYGKTVQVRTPSEPFNVDDEFYKLLWLPWIKPTSYKITPSTGYCHAESFDGKAKSVYVDSYPEISWDIGLHMGYGKIEVNDANPEDKNKVSQGIVERKIEQEIFSVGGKATCRYDNETLEFGKDFTHSFDTLKKEMNDHSALFSKIFGRFQEGDNHKISISLPQVSFSGKASIAEQKDHQVSVKWDYSLKADPLFEIKAEADVLPMLIRGSGWGSLFLNLLKELKEDYANPDGSISAELEASIILSISGKAAFEFNFTDDKYVEDGDVKPEYFKVEIPFSCEGKALAKGKVFVFSVELGVSATLSSGFGYEMMVGQDAKGIYRQSNLAFHGLEFKLLMYIEGKVDSKEKIAGSEKSVFSKKNKASRKKEYKSSWEWMKPRKLELAKEYIIS